MNTVVLKNKNKKERGSLALEQILFIGAIVLMSGGIFAFYNDFNSYFDSFSTTAAPTDFGANSGTSSN